jgi:hypothetical protein
VRNRVSIVLDSLELSWQIGVRFHHWNPAFALSGTRLASQVEQGVGNMDAATIDSGSFEPQTTTLLQLVSNLTDDRESGCDVENVVLDLVAAGRVRLVGQVVAADLGL